MDNNYAGWALVIVTLMIYGITGFITIGKILATIKEITGRLAVKAQKITQIEAKMEHFVPILFCKDCRQECERRNTAQFGRIESLLIESNEKREDIFTILSHISERIARLEGPTRGGI